MIIFGIITKLPASHICDIPRRIPALNRQPRPSDSSKFNDVKFDSIIDVEIDTRDIESAKLGAKIGFDLCKLLSINCFDFILSIFDGQDSTVDCSERRTELQVQQV